ncbi:hypothetical protein HD806DRAFT_523567 [Xylariaceae sp. AK1471]|nr:hypothetical protein HD806DRAFT_523567 [Xylariaceae sp. AK1471]
MEEYHDVDDDIQPLIQLHISERARFAKVFCRQLDGLNESGLMSLHIKAVELMTTLCNKKETAKRKYIQQNTSTNATIKEESPRPKQFPLLINKTQCPHCIDRISQYVDLSQNVVCSDQSSKKSSVPEAISRISFPTKDALCTGFATELVLRRSTTQYEKPLKVSTIPGKDRSEDERVAIEKFAIDWQDLDLGNIIDRAIITMGLAGSDKVFCSEILRVEYSSPKQPHLTLVNLPGLFMAGSKDQSVEDAKLVETLVLSYIEQPRKVDPEGNRTLGLITKPDSLDVGSESEQAYFELARNIDVHFRLGWHVVRNRDFSIQHATNAERDAAEKPFFSRGVWVALDPNQLGVNALRIRLSKTLVLDKPGKLRENLGDQRRYLLSLSQAFTALVKLSVEGDYSDRNFFGDSAMPNVYEKRLRAQVQDSLTKFATSVRLRGHAKTIVENLNTASEGSQPLKVSR